jgi:DNA-binding CsgD family transcriptional regulator
MQGWQGGEGLWGQSVPPPLLEREVELETLGAVLAAASGRGEGATVWIEAPPGEGKTALLRSASQMASEAGAMYLGASGCDLEADFPFGVVRQLFDPVLRSAAGEVAGLLASGPAALAAPVFAGHASAPLSPEPNHATLYGLYWLTSELAARRPLVLAVDDVHWADGASRRFLTFLRRRIDGLPVVLLLAARPEGEWESRHDRARLLEGPPAQVLRPRALTLPAVAALVERDLGTAPAPEFAQACHTFTGGNPFLVGELLAELRRQGTPPAVASVEAIGSTRPASVGAMVIVRLSRLSGPARDLAAAVSVLGDRCDANVAARVAGLDPGEGRAATEELVAAGVLRDGHPLAFVHPIVRVTVHADLGPARSNRLHRLAADLLGDLGAPDDEVAAQLLHVAPAGQAATVGLMRTVARAALVRGAPEAAVTYLRRALDEGPPAAERAAIALELGQAELSVGDPRALDRLRTAAHHAPDAGVRLDGAASLARALALAGRNVEAAAELRAALDSSPTLEPLRRLALTVQLAGSERSRVSSAAEGHRLVRELAALPPDPSTSLGRAALAMVALDAALSARPAAAVRESASAALAAERPETVEEAALRFMAVAALLWTDHLEQTAAVLDRIRDEARRTASVLLDTMATALYSALELRRGDVGLAEADARAVMQRAGEHGWGKGLWMPVSGLASALIEQGAVEAAATVLDEAGPPDGDAGWSADRRLQRGRLLLARGEWRPALEELLATGDHAARWLCPSPAVLGWRAPAAVAAKACGDADLACRLAQEDLDLARSSGVPRAVGVALRTLAVVGDRAERIQRAAEAVAVLEASPARLELARAQTDLGMLLRLSGQPGAARRPLRAALDLAAGSGATALATRAYDELRATGAHPRRPLRAGTTLTASEQRVARLAAEGRSNGDIAQALFVTVKTVEFHLTGVYRKLGVDSRDELADRLGVAGPLPV